MLALHGFRITGRPLARMNSVYRGINCILNLKHGAMFLTSSCIP